VNWRSAVVQVVQDPESNRGLAAAVRAAAVRAGRAGKCDALQTLVGNTKVDSAAAEQEEGAKDPTEDGKNDAAHTGFGHRVDTSQLWSVGYWLYKENSAVETDWSVRMNYHSLTAELHGQSSADRGKEGDKTQPVGFGWQEPLARIHDLNGLTGDPNGQS